MSKKFVNNVNVAGYVFSHTLQERVSRKGVPFISGEVRVATDEDAMNVVPVNFRYVAEFWDAAGTKPNQNYSILQNLIANVKTFEEVGSAATKIRIGGSAGVNDFVTRDGEMASPKRVEGSFVHVNDVREFGATFNIDTLITKCIEQEYEDQDSVVHLSGYMWDFRKAIMPIDFTVRVPGGKDYFLGYDISTKNPLLTNVQGDIVSTVIENVTYTEGAFGDPVAHTTTRTIRGWDVNFASKEPMEFDDESTLTKKELKQMLDEREEHLAEVKKNHDEYQAQRNGNGFATTPKVASKPAAKAVVDDDDDDDFEF